MTLGYIGGGLGHLRPLVDMYRAAGEKAGHPKTLRVAISTHFYAAADDTEARAVYPYYREYLRPKTPGGRGWTVEEAAFEAGRSRPGAIMVGTSEQLIDKLRDARDALGLDRVYGQIDWGGLPAQLVQDSIGRLATDIAPALRDA